MTNAVDRTAQDMPVANEKGYALAIYILYIIAFFVGITALVGVIIAHVKKPTAPSIFQSHFQFQIYTFWIGLLYLVIGSFTLYFIIGGAVLLWWFVWTLVRVIKGLILLNDGRPIPQPTSWLFG